MKKFLSVLFTCLLSSVFAWSAARQATLIPVKGKDPRVHRHHAHKAAKHRAPKRAHRRV